MRAALAFTHKPLHSRYALPSPQPLSRKRERGFVRAPRRSTIRPKPPRHRAC
ncbi:hypothetical protein AZ78_2375 [Lysobacter capsici AZ78]|uniref:Uncharacterized protein n=1 Tax=Lysobacter capsici AZ78 TaxID=1444315 RepID=A0A108U943_9GAMM|nr:hypothetical protein AZ78_2375 [Lysobacter capsici AZ78]